MFIDPTRYQRSALQRSAMFPAFIPETGLMFRSSGARGRLLRLACSINITVPTGLRMVRSQRGRA